MLTEHPRKRMLNDAELMAELRDWLVASQTYTPAQVAGINDGMILWIVADEFPGGLAEAVDHYSPRVPVEA